MDGILNINKPIGPTSHDIVARVRRLSYTRRVGHAGTLDPPAQGVLVLFLGIATRLIEYTTDADKEYIADTLFGIGTNTLDATGEQTATADASALTRDQILAQLPHFTGIIQQVPPMFSAVHHDGQRLYELARRGEAVKREPRTVTVHALELLDFTPGPQAHARLRIVCSKGTYIRSLAADLGESLGLPAHLTALTRTRVGAYHIEDALSMETLTEAAERGELEQLLLPTRTAVAHLPAITLVEPELTRVRHGNAITCPPPKPGEPNDVRLVAITGGLLGIGRREPRDDHWRVQPVKILVPAP